MGRLSCLNMSDIYGIMHSTVGSVYTYQKNKIITDATTERDTGANCYFHDMINFIILALNSLQKNFQEKFTFSFFSPYRERCYSY